jgi:hypothetical protein
MLLSTTKERNMTDVEIRREFVQLAGQIVPDLGCGDSDVLYQYLCDSLPRDEGLGKVLAEDEARFERLFDEAVPHDFVV